MTAFTKPGQLMATTALALTLGATAVAADIRFWTTENQPERLQRQEQMAADFEAESGIAVEVIPDAVEAYARARAVAGDDDLVLVAGSLYLVGEIRPVARSVVDPDDYRAGGRHNRS